MDFELITYWMHTGLEWIGFGTLVGLIAKAAFTARKRDGPGGNFLPGPLSRCDCFSGQSNQCQLTQRNGNYAPNAHHFSRWRLADTQYAVTAGRHITPDSGQSLLMN